MKRVMLFEDFINESSIMNYQEMIEYITEITPDHSDVPDYFFQQLRKAKAKFIRKNVKISDVMRKDKSVKNYILSGEDRYGADNDDDYVPYDDELDYPIVIFNNSVIDGYSRLSEHYRRGIKDIVAWVG